MSNINIKNINSKEKRHLWSLFIRFWKPGPFKDKNVLQSVVILAIYVAWFGLSATAIYIGYIPIGHTQITYLPIIVVMATFHVGIIGNITTGLSFGFSSWIAAFIYGIPKYQLFDLAVLPRFEMALLVLGLFYLLNLWNRPKLWKIVLISILAIMFNQYLVLSSQYLREAITGTKLLGKGVPPIHIWIYTHLLNVIAEPIIGAILITCLYPVLKKVKAKYLDNKKIYY
ncbi:hypothetical protein [Mycoplasmopsis felifaucium]|uniref:ECF transporter S component n=1 Tax=Mycoplasmopsis felifaucium TaxID=35768 RepID=A0ABZ2RPJ8_9BACT